MPGALANVLASKMVRKDHTSKGTEVSRAEAAALCKTMKSVYASPPVLRAVVADLIKCFLVDPAADGLLQPMLFFKGFHALQVYRVAHMLWGRGGTADQAAALMLQSPSLGRKPSSSRRRWKRSCRSCCLHSSAAS